jgi:alpha-tubulin suppressor-like RCC1 family protein
MNTKRYLIQICLLGAVLLQALTSGAQPVTKVVGAGYFSLFLKNDGSLWAMGDNIVGQLGDGTGGPNVYTNWPEQIVASNVTAIAAGGFDFFGAYRDESLFLKSDGSLWVMGENEFGQLGDGTYNNTNLPEMIVASNVTAIASDGTYSLFLKSDGSLWAMGNNSVGQLGDGTYSDTNLPEMIVASNVTAIAAGEDHSLFIKNNGSLWAMGDNSQGELGDGMSEGYTNLPEQIVASNVTAIATGGYFSYFSLFLKKDGSLWAMGDESYGELGDGVSGIYGDGTFQAFTTNLPEQIVASNVTAIAAGGRFSLFVKKDGSLWVMGDNTYGELGDGTTDNGNYETNLPEPIVSSGVTAIAAGQWHSLFIKSDGSLWGMGDDADGDLGDGGAYSGINLPEQIVAGTPVYNQIFVELLSGGNVSLSYVGNGGMNYELDQSFSLSPANWVPQVTNPAGAGGVLVFTNTPNPATNNFWRVRSVP